MTIQKLDENQSVQTTDYLHYAGKLYGIVCLFLVFFLFYYQGFIFVGDAPAYGKPASNFGVPGPGFFHFFLSGDFFVETAGRGIGIILFALSSIAMLFDLRVLQKLLFYLTFLILGLLFFPMFFKTELIRLFLYYCLFLWLPLMLKVLLNLESSL
ncbi:MAG: hypothetical protein CVV41_06225 [Candidatus Riflebacteria bacterium HGW-Riflebacteria-1]|jgi:hypothetical protein|nr:MAG: hypothetical protein CVV41_06225 [Candidatus Riflebacteria bacterium HGW-Riflebacteria-1]